MKKFSFKDELQKIVSTKQLVQVHFQDDPSQFKVAYILAVNNDFITLIEVDSSAAFDGVCIYPMEDVTAIKVDSLYVGELAKRVSDSIHAMALQEVKNVKKFTFEGFISGFENSKTVVEISYEKDDGRAGRIIDHDNEVVVFDEYREEGANRLARAYIKLDSILRISVDVPWTRTVSRSLIDKNF
ncbi:hypothetical protein C5B42_00550 [Candidatus Cerribacteria bacterium 'Amazon FNV 2010 28 9']|uniref:Uncharacterized protein n=1 Tax=Candidatus Cerribacteria bacterium 'Amazon FNV 2010 28 9' TaxID=2081795 RepID=A0A317JPX9_9BACT|nr:MAG: hypothetical protein C5B42_00550 [Candidatus Cerribacteria bacterium 'Amazon FNV 2010 28 9']